MKSICKKAAFWIAVVVGCSGTALPVMGEGNECGLFSTWPPTEQEFREVYGRLKQQQTREEFHKSPSMIFRSPESIEQALKRRLFNQPTMQAVAERDLVGKSVKQASRKLQGLGFDGNLHTYGWHEPHECKRVTNVFVGISLLVEKEMVKSVIVKLFGQCQGKNWC